LLRLIKYSTRIPSDFCYIKSVTTDLIYSLQSEYGFIEEDILFELKVIVNELLINAIRHGNNETSNKYVKVAAGMATEKYAFILIEDQGEGCNYNCIIKSRNKHVYSTNFENVEESGRGLQIVNCLSDRIRFNRRGNRILILKKLISSKSDNVV